jgi:protein-L-isoaspartate(D-aspartate) O-methyltransferase
MTALAQRRRFFAEELEAVCRLQTPSLVNAFAQVERERYLPAGPWTVAADSDLTFALGSGGARFRTTPDADPARVYHNIAVAIDPARQLFNGQPGTLGFWIDRLGLTAGMRAMHVGCGLGYYTAVMAECVGDGGRVLAFEVDQALADGAKNNLASRPWIEVRRGDASGPIDETFDAILVNAGVTHPLDTWLDALAPAGRMILPLTVEMPAMGATLGKGLVVLVTRDVDGLFSARIVTAVAVYSAIGIRDQEMSERIGRALAAGPGKWGAVTRLRRDAHEAGESCWLHRNGCCFSCL